MTEDKAKTKWCPFVRGDNGDNAINRWCDGAVPDGKFGMSYCIGSQCMAWRWIDALTVPQKDRRGCCGLAGRP